MCSLIGFSGELQPLLLLWPQVNRMKTPRSLQETHQGTKWIEEGREQAKESKREGRQRGLTANPVPGQLWTGP